MTNKEAAYILSGKCLEYTVEELRTAYALAINALEERPHGYWTTPMGSLEINCSVCNKGYFYHPNNHFYYNFCPHCGADMRGNENG